MIRIFPVAAVACFAALVPFTLADESGPSPVRSPDQTEQAAAGSDLLAGAIDPYQPGVERLKFFRDAGPDGELDRAEFDKSRRNVGGFIRRFDSWGNLSLFDLDGSGAISWFEAEQYRQATRITVVERFDVNSNRKLDNAERERAAAYIESQIVAVDRQRLLDLKAQQTNLQRLEARIRTLKADLDAAKRGGAPDEQIRRMELFVERNRGALRAEARFVEQNDIDGSGDVSHAEWRARQQKKVDAALARRLEEYDRDRNGRIDPEEYELYRNDRNEQVLFWKIFDKDQDGQLDDSERTEWEKSPVYKHWAAFDAADRNKDGILDLDEQRTYLELRVKDRYPDDWQRRQIITEPNPGEP
jgi:hypothetical protein